MSGSLDGLDGIRYNFQKFPCDFKKAGRQARYSHGNDFDDNIVRNLLDKGYSLPNNDGDYCVCTLSFVIPKLKGADLCEGPISSDDVLNLLENYDVVAGQ